MKFIEKSILTGGLLLSFSCSAAEIVGSVHAPEYTKPSESIADFMKRDDWQNEAFFLKVGSILCGSKKGIEKIYHEYVIENISNESLIDNNCAKTRQYSVTRVLKDEGRYSFVEFVYSRVKTNNGVNFSHTAWIRSYSLNKIEKYES